MHRAPLARLPATQAHPPLASTATLCCVSRKNAEEECPRAGVNGPGEVEQRRSEPGGNHAHVRKPGQKAAAGRARKKYVHGGRCMRVRARVRVCVGHAAHGTHRMACSNSSPVRGQARMPGRARRASPPREAKSKNGTRGYVPAPETTTCRAHSAAPARLCSTAWHEARGGIDARSSRRQQPLHLHLPTIYHTAASSPKPPS